MLGFRVHKVHWFKILGYIFSLWKAKSYTPSFPPERF